MKALALFAGLLFSTASAVLGTEVHDAAKECSVSKVRAILDTNPAAISTRDSSGKTALHFATRCGSTSCGESGCDRGTEQTDVLTLLLNVPAVEVNAIAGNGLTPLHRAVFDKSCSAACALISKGANVNATNNDGNTPLHNAIASSLWTVADRLARVENIAVGIKNNDGYTALHFLTIACLDNTDLAEVLLAKDPDLIMASDQEGNTPLHFAAITNCLKMAQLLVAYDRGALNARNNYDRPQTPLQHGLQGYKNEPESDDHVIYFLLAPSNLTEASAYGSSPLHIALEKGFQNIALRLLARKSYIDAKDDAGKTALHIALEAKRRHVASQLIVQGSDIHSEAKDSTTPLHIAANEGLYDLTEILLNLGANVNAKDKDGETPLHKASSSEFDNPVVRLLLDRGANTEAQAYDGDTPLHHAVAYSNVSNIRLLLPRSDITAKTETGKTVFHTAVDSTNVLVFRLLTKEAKGRGVDIDFLKDSAGRTALGDAMDKPNVDYLRILINEGVRQAKVEYDLRGWSLLHAASSLGRANIVRVLCEAGYSVTTRDKRGRTPLEIATERGHRQIIKVLLGPKCHPKEETLRNTEFETHSTARRNDSSENSDQFR